MTELGVVVVGGGSWLHRRPRAAPGQVPDSSPRGARSPRRPHVDVAFAGKQVEMGGTWVHWHQPYVWAELRRYGLEVTEATPPTTVGWLVGRELKQGPPEELWRLMADGTDRMCHGSPRVARAPAQAALLGHLRR